jgi:hypothetical protein
MRPRWAAFVVTLAFSASAYAGTVYATGTPSFNALTDTGATMNATNMGNLAGAPDGSFATITGIDSNGGSNNDVFTITFAFAPGGPTTSGGSFKLVTGSGGGSWNGLTLSLTNIQWTGGSSPGNNNSSFSGGSTLNSPSTSYSVTNIGWSNDFTGLVLTFVSTQGNNKTATFDAISATSVPEPGTWALFGLGALGLCAFVRAKRRTRVALAPRRAR